MKNLILTLAIILFAIPVFAYTLEIDKVVKEKRETYEVCKMTAIDVKSSNLIAGKEGLRSTVEENLKKQFSKGKYRYEILEYKQDGSFKICVYYDKVKVTYASTSL